MIINWKKPNAGVLVLPVVKDNKVIKTLILLPGHNEIATRDWEAAKINCKLHIEAGFLEEVIVLKTEKPKTEGGKEIKKEILAENLQDLDANAAKNIVLDTFNLDTLNDWLSKEARDEIRALIHNQIEMVNQPAKQPKKRGLRNG